MDNAKRERIRTYVKALKLEIEKLEFSLEDGGDPQVLNNYSKTLLLSAAVTDEAISRVIADRTGHHSSTGNESTNTDNAA